MLVVGCSLFTVGHQGSMLGPSEDEKSPHHKDSYDAAFSEGCCSRWCDLSWVYVGLMRGYTMGYSGKFLASGVYVGPNLGPMASGTLSGAQFMANMWFHVIFLSCFCCGDFCKDPTLRDGIHSSPQINKLIIFRGSILTKQIIWRGPFQYNFKDLWPPCYRTCKI